MFGLGVWGHLLNFGVGLAFRFLNEERKSAQMNHELNMAAATQNAEMMRAARENLGRTPVLQVFLGIMLMSSLAALIAFPLVAVYLDVPLVFIWERAVETGIFFKRMVDVQSIETVTGLFLPHEFQTVIIVVLEFITGAVVGGLGRR